MEKEQIIEFVSSIMRDYFEKIIQPYITGCVYTEAKALLEMEKKLIDM